MTGETLHLMAVLAWPAVAVIAAFAFLRGIYLLSEVVNDAVRCSDRWRATYLERGLLVEERRARTAAAVARLAQSQGVITKSDDERTKETAERAMLALLQANGGIPWSPREPGSAQLVREIRKLYQEIEHPTPEPANLKSELEADDLTLDEPDDANADDQDYNFDATVRGVL